MRMDAGEFASHSLRVNASADENVHDEDGKMSSIYVTSTIPLTCLFFFSQLQFIQLRIIQWKGILLDADGKRIKIKIKKEKKNNDMVVVSEIRGGSRRNERCVEASRSFRLLLASYVGEHTVTRIWQIYSIQDQRRRHHHFTRIQFHHASFTQVTIEEVRSALFL